MTRKALRFRLKAVISFWSLITVHYLSNSSTEYLFKKDICLTKSPFYPDMQKNCWLVWCWLLTSLIITRQNFVYKVIVLIWFVWSSYLTIGRILPTGVGSRDVIILISFNNQYLPLFYTHHHIIHVTLLETCG